MSKIEEIRTRLERGYVISLYGNSEYLYEQMEDDISSLLILFDAQKLAIEDRIKELEKDPYLDSEYKKHRIKELKRLLK